MKKTKLIALLLAAALSLSLAACGNDGNTDDTTDTNDTADTGNEDDGTPVYSKGLDENGYFEGVRALDYVTLPEYKGVEIDIKLMVADEERVQAELDAVLVNHAEEITDTSAVIKDGDTVNIDYVGYVDGEEFGGGNTGGLGTDVTIGVTDYIDDFLEQLIGHHPGDSFDVEVTFPEDYGKDELNGKDAVFKVTINYIQGELVLTDEIAAEYDFENSEAFLEDIRRWVLANDRFEFCRSIIAKAEVSDVPQNVIDYLIALEMDTYEYYAEMYGITLDQYIAEYTEYENKDAYIEGNMESYKEDAKFYLAAQAMAEAENITVTTEQIVEAGYESYIAEMGEPYLKQYMLFQHVLPEYIAVNGKVAE